MSPGGDPSLREKATFSSEVASVQQYEKPKTWTQSLFGFFNIFGAFLITFVPLITVAILLSLFVVSPMWGVENPSEQNAALPVEPLNNAVFYTTVLSSNVILTSSSASNIAQFASAPFMLLFSFLIACELAKRRQVEERNTTRSLQSDKLSLWKWVIHRFWSGPHAVNGNGTRLAGCGALLSLSLTLLLVIGDKVLQGTVANTSARLYSLSVSEKDRKNTSFMLNRGYCPLESTIPDPYQLNASPPCSISQTTNDPNLLDSPKSYRLLATGLLNQTHDYQDEDFAGLKDADDAGTFDGMQVVTYIDKETLNQHAFFFDPIFAEESTSVEEHHQLEIAATDYERFGLDYVAQTTSVVTKCSAISSQCGMRSKNSSYHCSDMFQGNISEIPGNGVQKLKGWNISFYDLDNGIPLPISIASQLSPFSYNVTIAVDSIDYASLQLSEQNIPDVAHQTTDGTIIDMDNGRVGFALSCNSTVYNVTYALVNGSVLSFQARPADPSEAAIIKAPPQLGFGSYGLFEKVTMSVLFTKLTVMDAMKLAFSQTLLALAAGAYEPAASLDERYRADFLLTTMKKVPFYFLVKKGVRESQARLLPRE
ncbi:hypothetical protein EJ04DRAFT_568418 [Polyplosphaeria fusca]|uniref:Uncharacterized protein n=1 Tax=Polyplosphaeria fusca TaxID=682080 RepID=A0A9P4UWU1_9PLEO|nr:hypothetical protein EJ04DRAFT_568418 [Polyplosphaeria fusca]